MRAVRPLLALVFPVLLLSVGCDGDDHEGGQLGDRVAALEAQLAEETDLSEEEAARSQVFEVAHATSRIDAVDLVGLTQRLGAGESARPTDVSAVSAAARAMKHARWPSYLQLASDDVIELLDQLAEALAGRDSERAAKLAPQVLASKNQLLLKADGWLASVDPWSRRSQPGHGHHDHGEAHADHDPRHGGLLGMSGDLHLELVAVDPGTFRVYLSDAVRRPVEAHGVSGTLVLNEDASNELELTWQQGGRDFLEATTEAQAGSKVPASVRLSGTTEGEVVMDFLLPLRPAPQSQPATQPAAQTQTTPSGP